MNKMPRNTPSNADLEKDVKAALASMQNYVGSDVVSPAMEGVNNLISHAVTVVMCRWCRESTPGPAGPGSTDWLRFIDIFHERRLSAAHQIAEAILDIVVAAT